MSIPDKRPAGANPPRKLVDEILARSSAATWDAAAPEWVLEEVKFASWDDPGTCLCGHHPIIELCFLRNRVNANRATVGNCCVRGFLGLPVGAIFTGLRRVAARPDRALPAAVADHAHTRGWITDWERAFCTDTLGNTRLSPRQVAIRREICANRGAVRCLNHFRGSRSARVTWRTSEHRG